jgi:flavin-dependent dehydrogenase
VAERDLLVVGGGPAGLAVAIRARLAGLSVTLVERMRPPIDRACGEGMLPDTAAALDELGVVVDESGRAPLHGIRYLSDGVVAEGRFPGRPAWGVRRTALHAALVQRAGELGAELRWGTAAEALSADGVRAGTELLDARILVGADGRDSMMRRWAGLEATSEPPDRHGVRRHFALAPWSDLVEVYWGNEAEAYVTPVGPGQVCVAMLWSGAAARFEVLLPSFPELEARLAGAPASSKDRGATHLGSRARDVVQGRVALVGDAAGGVDPITGEGVSLALREARALVDAVVAGDLASYARAQRRIARVPRLIGRTLLLLQGRPQLRRGVIAGLAADEALFSRLLGFMTGAVPARRLGPFALLRLVVRTLATREGSRAR